VSDDFFEPAEQGFERLVEVLSRLAVFGKHIEADIQKFGYPYFPPVEATESLPKTYMIIVLTNKRPGKIRWIGLKENEFRYEVPPVWFLPYGEYQFLRPLRGRSAH
jgi:hypothetical protein